jgi:Uma2 family endonuclease
MVNLGKNRFAMITSLDQLDPNGTYTYADYLTWRFEQFVELLRGRIMPMSAPSRWHQKVSGNLFLSIGSFLQQHRGHCEIYAAPFDVRLVKPPLGKSDKEIYTVVQPDLCVICDPAKLDAKGCLGPPDWVVEILSEGNSQRDIHDKFMLYQENGVREYWLVRPSERSVERFALENGAFVFKGFFVEGQTASPLLFPELAIDLAQVFALGPGQPSAA